MNLQDISAIATAGSTFVTSVSLIVTILALWSERRKANKLLCAQYLVKAQDKYDEICWIRAQNPNFRTEANSWSLKSYDVMSKEELSYNYYIEMTLGFIETYVYLTFMEKVIPRPIFFQFIKPMIWLEVNHNYKAFCHYTNAQSISEISSAFLQDLVREIGENLERKNEEYSPEFNKRIESRYYSKWYFSEVSYWRQFVRRFKKNLLTPIKHLFPSTNVKNKKSIDR